MGDLGLCVGVNFNVASPLWAYKGMSRVAVLSEWLVGCLTILIRMPRNRLAIGSTLIG